MRVSFDDLKAGMTLAEDLQEPGGRLLLPAATVLTDRHLRYFQMWGIGEAEIEGDAPQAGPSDAQLGDPALIAEAETRMTSLFRHADITHPVDSQVFRHCVTREVRRLASVNANRDG
jgi:hypothetical protein